VAARLVLNSAHHTATLKNLQRTINILTHHRPAPLAALLDNGHARRARRGGPARSGKYLDEISAQLFGVAHAFTAVVARR